MPASAPPQLPGKFGIRLNRCPQCSYSFQGLPAAGRCPECGFVYDDSTFVLDGISRGVSTMNPWRVAGWIYIGVFASFGPQLVLPLVFGRAGGSELAIVLAIFAVIWLVVLIWLLATGKKEKRGMEPFLFASGGFGSCGDLTAESNEKPILTPWRDVDTVLLEQKGKTWFRLRIGREGSRPGTFYQTALDAGVRCDSEGARHVRHVIERYIATANGTDIAPPALPEQLPLLDDDDQVETER